MDQFEIAFGHCTVRDGVLTIDRADLEEMGRWDVFRTELRTGAGHRPIATSAWIGLMLVGGLLFVTLLGSLYLLDASLAPLVGALGLFGLLGVGGAFEFQYRRQLLARRQLQTTLADEFPLDRPSQIPLENITGVTIKPVSTGRLLSDGWLFLVHFQHNEEEATTALGFPKMMDQQIDSARSIFEEHDIPIKEEG